MGESSGLKSQHPEAPGPHYLKGYPRGLVWARCCLIFYEWPIFFIEKSNLYNYADDNVLDSSSDDLLEAMLNLKRDGRNAID